MAHFLMYITIHSQKFENVSPFINETNLHNEKEFLNKTEGKVLNNQIQKNCWPNRDIPGKKGAI